MNKVILMGRLTRDPEVRYSAGESGTAIARYTLAVDRRFKRDGEATADFISCVSFGRTAEFAEKYFRQGLKIIVSGRIQTGSYTNRDGQKVYTTEVVVEEQEFAEGKNFSQQGAGQQPPQNYGGQQNAPQQSVPQQNAPQQSQPQGYGQQGGYNVPQQSVPQQNAPQQSQPQGYGQQGGYNVPQQSVPQQNAPQQSQPQGYGQQGGYNVPQQSVPKSQPQGYGQQSVPQQNAPQQNYGGGSFGMGDDGFMNIPEGLDDELPFN
nr:single-stranded DNA-binding protein [Blautia wexlerae]